MKKHKYYYCVDELESFEDMFDFESSWEAKHKQFIAEDAAEDYNRNHDGWECTWPEDFYIYNHKKQFLGLFRVEREFDPNFHAYQIKTEKKENE